MIHKITAANRYHAKQGWLSSYHLFSFADYYDPNNLHFGSLRVFNDDTIDPHSGFGAHSHDNMEIITIVLDGELTHQDSIGNTGVIRAGEVQHMSAGAGVTHAEMNASDKPLHLYQIWIIPVRNDITPEYHQQNFSNVIQPNALMPVASGQGKTGALVIHADTTISLLSLEPSKTLSYVLNDSRGLFIYVSTGRVQINEEEYSEGDQARITQEKQFKLVAQTDAKLVLIDVPLE